MTMINQHIEALQDVAPSSRISLFNILSRLRTILLRRRDFAHLRTLSEEHLRDVGMTHGDVETAWAGKWRQDPATTLERLRRARLDRNKHDQW